MLGTFYARRKGSTIPVYPPANGPVISAALSNCQLLMQFLKKRMLQCSTFLTTILILNENLSYIKIASSIFICSFTLHFSYN